MRFFRLTVLLVALFCNHLFAADVWYNEYDSALKAIKNQNWSEAEKHLNAAIKDQPNSGKNLKTYGVGNYINYYPDYYLGVVYFRQSKYQEALSEFERVRIKNVLVAGDPEFVEMQNLLKQSQAALGNVDAKSEIAQARSLLSDGKLEEATKVIQVIKQKAPKDPDLPALEQRLADLKTEKNKQSQIASL